MIGKAELCHGKASHVSRHLNLREFAWALVPVVALLALWELGKLVARRAARSRSASPQESTS